MHSKLKVCSECGQQFITAYGHIYKTKTKDGVKLQCGWNCYRKAQEKNTHRDYASRRREHG